jgi:DNA-binding response OmpR family regulator
MARGKILLVEDDVNLGFVVKDNLEISDFEVDWHQAGDTPRNLLESGHDFDIIILDVMLPNMDGFKLAQYIRSMDEWTPILFLTARSEEEDRLRGFEIGGDDYITKPFSIKELIYRVNVFLRRPVQEDVTGDSQKNHSIGSFVFSYPNLSLTNDSDTYLLTQLEADLLRLLFDNRDEIVRREDILVNLWGENDYFKGRSLDVFISRLRKYFRDDPSVHIKNHHGVGFRLVID